MKVSLLFDSPEDFGAFGARLGPILEEMGMDGGEPEFLEVHNIIRRGGN
jgi:hypothetical protein